MPIAFEGNIEAAGPLWPSLHRISSLERLFNPFAASARRQLERLFSGSSGPRARPPMKESIASVSFPMFDEITLTLPGWITCPLAWVGGWEPWCLCYYAPPRSSCPLAGVAGRTPPHLSGSPPTSLGYNRGPYLSCPIYSEFWGGLGLVVLESIIDL